MPDTTRPRLSAQDWIDAALQTLVEEGIEGIRIDRLCARMGVTKGSFYWHFKNREAVLDAVAEHWTKLRPALQTGRLEKLTGSPRDRLAAMTQIFLDQDLGPIDHAMRAWAQSDERAAAAVEAADQQTVKMLSGLLKETGLSPVTAGIRARMLMFCGIGGYGARHLMPTRPGPHVIGELIELAMSPEIVEKP